MNFTPKLDKENLEKILKRIVMMIITFTGLDENVNYNDILEIRKDNHFVEFGILYSIKNAGKEPRYPSLKWINEYPFKSESALHVCGSAVGKLIKGDDFWFTAVQFGRVQLNFNTRWIDFSFDELYNFIEKFAPVVITQHNHSNKNVIDETKYNVNHQFLIDSSGGRGVEAVVPKNLPNPDRIWGFAGGIGPDNIGNIYREAHNSGFSWIDMESKVRDHNDAFSLDLVKKCLDNINQDNLL